MCTHHAELQLSRRKQLKILGKNWESTTDWAIWAQRSSGTSHCDNVSGQRKCGSNMSYHEHSGKKCHVPRVEDAPACSCAALMGYSFAAVTGAEAVLRLC